MRRVKTLAIALLCAATLATSSTAMARPRRASCCKMKHCCYENKRCCKKANHACCTGKHMKDGVSCCCKAGSCPMPPKSVGMTTDKWVPPVHQH